MKLELAREDQSEELAGFFKQFPLRGPVEILIDRRPNFYKPFQIQGPESRVYTLRDEDEGNSLLGLAGFTFSDLWLEGRPQRVAYARDLRILETRKAVLGWSQHFLPVMDEVRREARADVVVSILNQNEVKAMNAFVRPRPMRRALPRYFLFRRFNLVSLHGQFPWAPKPLDSIRIRPASGALEDALIDYIVRKTREREFGTAFDADRFLDKLARWDNLTLEDFLVATDSQDRVIGCCAPWNAGGIQEYIPLRYNLVGHNFRQFLKFGRMLGWTRTLTKPVHRLGMEAALDFRYLCFLFADNEDIFESLAWTAYEDARDTEFLVYTQMRSDLHLRAPLTWVSAKQAFGLYVLLPPEQDLPDFLRPSNERSAEMEPFFV